jgi:hypothetical protein
MATGTVARQSPQQSLTYAERARQTNSHVCTFEVAGANDYARRRRIAQSPDIQLATIWRAPKLDRYE